MQVKVWIDRISMAGNPIAKYNNHHIHVRGAEPNELVLAEVIDTGYPGVAKTIRTICSVDSTKAWSLSEPNRIDQFNHKADNEAPEVIQAANRLAKLSNTQDGFDITDRILKKVKPRTAAELDQVGRLVKRIKRINHSNEFASSMHVIELVNNLDNEKEFSELADIIPFELFDRISTEEMMLRIACLITGEEFHSAKRLVQNWAVDRDFDYQKQKEIAEESSGSDRLDKWMKLLPEASRRDITEFRWVVANCLHHISENISADEGMKLSLHNAAKCAYQNQNGETTDVFGQEVQADRKNIQNEKRLDYGEIDIFIAETASLLDISIPKIERLSTQSNSVQNRAENVDKNSEFSNQIQSDEEQAQNEPNRVNEDTTTRVESEIHREQDRTYTDEQLKDLKKRAEQEAQEQVQPAKNTKTAVKTQQYVRSNAVKRYVKARANGFCESCEKRAPFENPQGEPYLHAHHVYELSDGGSDTIGTVIALCPNCHYRVHHGKDGESFNEDLIEKLGRIEADSE